ncbi:MAG TPA: RsmB/NOP family class I SAM-dependent RNA methyltransferase [Propionibacteriaceae bacterium]|nr:RsmB/NOP family class I SAM-dependent RNA methyltransferase [Propionibacteriaceae bacterium]
MRRRRVDPARRVAFDALRAVHADDAYANLAIANLLRERRISGRDAAFATELVAGTCRMQHSYDAIIEAASGRKPNTLQPAMLDILRLGTHQLLGMRVPTHAAVTATVDLASSAVGERVSGLTNAVLRKVSARPYQEWVDQLTVGLDGLDRLALQHAHPRWVVEAFADLLPADELDSALAADNLAPQTSLVVRPTLLDSAELVAAGGVPGRLSPFAVTWPGNPADSAAVRSGTAGVQDEGSQLVAWALARGEAAPGWWLDLCAGPGGKTALLAGLASHQGSRVLANEVSPHRAKLVADAVRAFGREQVALVVGDGTRPAWRAGSFPRVLADVPCSGLGSLRRRPESRWRRGPESVEELHPLQLALLREALEAAAPGGLVAYVTCSPHRRETTDVIEEVLADRPDVSVQPAATLLPEVVDAERGDFLQLWPHRHGTDAMFAAYLRVGRD